MRIEVYFNTGRGYSAAGQIVQAAWDEDSCVLQFRDETRMISGSFGHVWLVDRTPVGLARETMRLYDLGGFRHGHNMPLPEGEPRPIRL